MSSESVGFYLLGKKGFEVLTGFVKQKGSFAVAYVIGSRDSGVDNDFYDEIRSLCTEHKIHFADRNDAVIESNFLDSYKFCIGWRWIIKNPDKLIVFHDSPLPRYRGFAPLVNMLINGEPEIGVTALMASEEYDQGDIICSEYLDITYPLKIETAIEKIIPLYLAVAIRVYDSIIKNTLAPHPQNEENATYSLWRDEEDYLIDWRASSEWISRFCDSVSYPYKGAKTYLNDESFRILEANPVADVKIEGREHHVGKVIFKRNNHPVVVCGTGLLKIHSLIDDKGVDVAKSVPFRSRFERKP